MSIFEKVKEPLSKLQALINKDINLRMGMIKEIEKHPVVQEIRKIQDIIHDEERNMEYITCSIPNIGVTEIKMISSKKTGRNQYYGTEDHFIDPVFHSRLGLKGQHQRDRINQGQLVMRDLTEVKKTKAIFVSEDIREIKLDFDPALYSYKKVNQENLAFFLSYIDNLINVYQGLSLEVNFGEKDQEGSLLFSLAKKEKRSKMDNKIFSFEFPSLRKGWHNSYSYGSSGYLEMDYVNLLGFSLDQIQKHHHVSDIPDIAHHSGANQEISYEKPHQANSIIQYSNCFNSVVDNWDKIDKGLKEFYAKKIKIFDLIKSDYKVFKTIIQTQATINKLKN